MEGQSTSTFAAASSASTADFQPSAESQLPQTGKRSAFDCKSVDDLHSSCDSVSSDSDAHPLIQRRVSFNEKITTHKTYRSPNSIKRKVNIQKLNLETSEAVDKSSDSTQQSSETPPTIPENDSSSPNSVKSPYSLSLADTLPSSPLSPGLSPSYDRTADTFTYSPTQFRYIKLELVKLRHELFPKGHFFGDARPPSVQEQYKH